MSKNQEKVRNTLVNFINIISSQIVNNKKYTINQIKQYCIYIKFHKFYYVLNQFINNQLYYGIKVLKFIKDKDAQIKSKN
jgi:hypothetical protein